MLGKIYFLIVLALLCFSTASAQNDPTQEKWKKVTICGITFSVPSSMKHHEKRSVDSCVAALGDGTMSLSLDYGLYSGTSRFDHYIDFKKRKIRIDRRTGSLATYRDPTMDPRQCWVAVIFVDVEPPRHGWGPLSLNMSITFGELKELAKAQRIFRSIKFK